MYVLLNRFLTIFIACCLLQVTANAQTYYQITHLAGTQANNGVNITVTPTGFVTSANYCGADPYAIGRNLNFITGYGKYGFNFSTPVVALRIYVTALNSGTASTPGEVDSFFVNGSWYPLSAPNFSPSPGSCSPLSSTIVNGNLTAALSTGNSGTGAQIDISGISITSFAISTNGAENGNTVGVYFAFDLGAHASNNGPLCAGQTLNLTGSGAPNATFVWTGPGGYTSSQQNPVRTNVTTAMAGMYHIAATSNGVTTFDSTLVVINNPAPTPVATTNAPICAGGTLNLFVTPVSGVTYSWVGPNSFSSNQQNPSIPNVTTAANGIYTVSGTVVGCPATPGTIAVTITPVPSISTVVVTNPTGCGNNNGSIQLNGLLPNTLYTVNYTLNGVPASPSTGITNAAGTLTMGSLGSGIYNNIVVISGGCSSSPKGPYTLSPGPTLPAPTASSNTPVCVGGTLQLNAFPPVNFTGGTFSWTGPNGFTSNQQNPAISNITAAAAGTYSVVYTLNGCVNATTTTVTIAAAPPAPTVSSNSPACINGTLQLNASATGAITYQWNGPNGFTSSQQNPAISPVVLATAGTYSVTASIGGCTSAPAVTTVTTQPQPAPPVPNNVTYCNGATNAVALTATGTNLRWYTAATGGTGSTVAPVPVTTNGTITYYVTQTNSNGCESDRAALVVTITQPPAPVVVSPLELCQFTAPVQLTATGTNLLWFNTATGGVQLPGAPTPATNVPGTFNYYVSQTIAGCMSARAQLTVLVKPKPAPPSATSPIGFCQYDVVNLSATGQNLRWYSTPTGGQPGVPSVTVPTAYEDSLYYYVTQSVNGCESDRFRVRVYVSYKPNGIVLPTRLAVCEGELDSFSYFGNATPPQAVFNWSTVNGINHIISGQGTTGPVVVRFDSAGTHSVRVQVNNRGCLSEIASQPVTVRANPRIYFNNPEDACQDEVINVALASITPAIDSFHYTFPGATIIYGTASGGPWGITYHTPGPKVITNTAFSRGCLSRPFSDTINVHPLPDASFTTDKIGICSGDSVQLNVRHGDSDTRYYYTPDNFYQSGNIYQAIGVVKANGYLKVEAVTKWGCKAADSVLITAKPCCELFFPNAFSPNNDNHNDVFRPVTNGHQEIRTFRIINRWGQVVYETKEDRAGWNGQYNGKDQDVGTYYYFISYRCDGSDEFLEQKGEVMLVR